LVAWYPFNGNANDESGNNLNLQIYGPSLSSDRFNNPNESFIFDGVQNSAEYLKLSDINTLKNNEFTYSVWFNSLEFYPETPTTDPYDYNNLNLQGLISLNSDNDWDIGPALSLKLKNSSNSIIRVTSWSNTNTSAPNKTSSSNLNASVEINKWYHLVYTYYNGNGKVYVNGVLKETFSSTIDYNLQNDLIIGGQRNGTNMDVMGGFNGKIDDIGIWSKALTQEEVIQIYNDSTAPTVTLTDTDSDNNVSNSDVVTITASFSESMSATPTLSLTGIVSDTQMSATASDSVWTYTWTVSTSVSSATATVSGTDLSGNAYSGTDSITFIIDNIAPTVSLTDTDSDNLVSNSDVVTITATFSESMTATPTLSLSGITSNAQMSATTSDTVWTYTWTVSTSVSSATATVSGTDLAGNAYSGTESITFGLQDIPDYLIEDSLVAWYPFNGNANDESGNNLNLQIYGPSLSSDRFNNPNESFIFDGVQNSAEYLKLSDINTLKNNEFTYSVWFNSLEFYPETPTTDPYDYNNLNLQGLISLNSDNNWDIGPALSLKLKNSSNSIIRVTSWSNTNTSAPNKTSSSNLNASVEINKWYHLVYTYYNGNGKVYVNGVLKETFSSTIDYNLQNDLIIGGQRNGTNMDVMGGFNGKIDDIGIWSKALTQEEVIQIYNDSTAPTVTLTDTDSDNNVSNSDVVTITATFSESMAATPTFSLSGIVSNAQMSATASDTVWTYTWTVSTTVTSTTATVSGTDLSGNAYSGTESITFSIDNTIPTLLSFGDTDQDNIVNNNTNVTLTATFSEPMLDSPAISISGLVTNTSMTVSASTNSTTWTYLWDVPAGNDGTYFATVSATDLIGNSYSGTESITFIIDNTAPEIESVSLNATNDIITLTFSEATFMSDAIADSVTVTDTSYYLNVTTTGGIATVLVDEIRYNANTDDRVYYLDLTISGTPDGNELVTILPASASRFKDRIGNYASDTSQTSNTLYLTNSPPRFTSTAVNSSNTSITIIFSEGVTAGLSGTELSNTDFTLSVSGGTAVLASATPSALSKTDSTTYVLTTSYTTPPNGSEILTVTPISTAVFDSKGTQIVMSALRVIRYN
jgi:transcription termination factor NusB